MPQHVNLWSVLTPAIRVFFVLWCVETVNGACPMGCYCDEKIVDCSSLMEFPMDLDSDTLVFKVSHLNVRDLPVKAFSYLQNISRVEFVNCNIANLNWHTFYQIPSINELVFDKTVIGNIESYAFLDLQNITQIQFSNSRIGRIKSFAFFGLKNITEIKMFNTHIRNFYTHAFYNCSYIDSFKMEKSNISDFVTGAFNKVFPIQKFIIKDTAFWNMHCGVMDDMQSTTDEFYFVQNTFYCNCSVSWLLNDDGASRYAYLKGVSTCHGPDGMVNKTSLTDVEFKELECKGLKSETKVPCERVILKPRPEKPPRPPGAPDEEEDDGPGGVASIPLTNGVIVWGLVVFNIVLWAL